MEKTWSLTFWSLTWVSFQALRIYVSLYEYHEFYAAEIQSINICIKFVHYLGSLSDCRPIGIPSRWYRIFIVFMFQLSQLLVLAIGTLSVKKFTAFLLNVTDDVSTSKKSFLCDGLRPLSFVVVHLRPSQSERIVYLKNGLT